MGYRSRRRAWVRWGGAWLSPGAGREEGGRVADRSGVKRPWEACKPEEEGSEPGRQGRAAAARQGGAARTGHGRGRGGRSLGGRGEQAGQEGAGGGRALGGCPGPRRRRPPRVSAGALRPGVRGRPARPPFPSARSHTLHELQGRGGGARGRYPGGRTAPGRLRSPPLPPAPATHATLLRRPGPPRAPGCRGASRETMGASRERQAAAGRMSREAWRKLGEADGRREHAQPPPGERPAGGARCPREAPGVRLARAREADAGRPRT